MTLRYISPIFDFFSIILRVEPDPEVSIFDPLSGRGHRVGSVESEIYFFHHVKSVGRHRNDFLCKTVEGNRTSATEAISQHASFVRSFVRCRDTCSNEYLTRITSSLIAGRKCSVVGHHHGQKMMFISINILRSRYPGTPQLPSGSSGLKYRGRS